MKKVPITRDMAYNTIKRMLLFKHDLYRIFDNYDMSLEKNICRRNQILSQAQENFLSQEISKKYTKAYCNGKTGQPDIIIPELNREIECKLTSINNSGSYSLQTDNDTLVKKVTLDYVYFLTDTSFENFCILYFSQLSRSDFCKLSDSSRGKIFMKKSLGMKKCTPIIGNFNDKTSNWHSDTIKNIRDITTDWLSKKMILDERLINEGTTEKKRDYINSIMQNGYSLFHTKLDKLIKKSQCHMISDPIYTFNLEKITLDKD